MCLNHMLTRVKTCAKEKLFTQKKKKKKETKKQKQKRKRKRRLTMHDDHDDLTSKFPDSTISRRLTRSSS
jgi:hypothetical protein